MTTHLSPPTSYTGVLPLPAMRTSLLMLALMVLVLSLPGCGRTVVRESKETIREQPVQVVEQRREILMEKPVEQSLSKPQRVCTYASSAFSSGTLSCQSGQQVRCEDGIWIPRGRC